MNYSGETYSYEQVIADMTLPSTHDIDVFYQDSQKREYTTTAVLDSELYKDTTWVDIKTVHNLVKVIEKQLEEQNKGLSAIHQRLVEFGTEHDGIWVYGSADDEEREFREALKIADRLESREAQDSFDYDLFGGRSGRTRRVLRMDEIVALPAKDAKPLDIFVPTVEDVPDLGGKLADFLRENPSALAIRNGFRLVHGQWRIHASAGNCNNTGDSHRKPFNPPQSLPRNYERCDLVSPNNRSRHSDWWLDFSVCQCSN